MRPQGAKYQGYVGWDLSHHICIDDINVNLHEKHYTVISDGKVIYESETSRAYREENRIFSQYEY
ncbi:MAG: hypothetical protein GY787_08660 [Alteromonadales bacterium]|nr:hypothetical protein [Alteromonadales bacterium]